MGGKRNMKRKNGLDFFFRILRFFLTHTREGGEKVLKKLIMVYIQKAPSHITSSLVVVINWFFINYKMVLSPIELCITCNFLAKKRMYNL